MNKPMVQYKTGLSMSREGGSNFQLDSAVIRRSIISQDNKNDIFLDAAASFSIISRRTSNVNANTAVWNNVNKAMPLYASYNENGT